jgi:hypothetical protein
VHAVTSVRQDGALVLGAQETVNAVDPATISRLFGDGSLSKAADGAVLGEKYAKDHRLSVGDPLTLTSLKGAKLRLVVRAIEASPDVDVSASARRDLRCHLRSRVRAAMHGARRRAGGSSSARSPASRTPGGDQGRLHRQPDGLDRRDPGILWVLLALCDRLAVRDRQHARALHVRAHARASGTLRASACTPPGAADGPSRA